MQVNIDENSVAHVGSVDIWPFLSIRDGSIDCHALTKLTAYVRRAAYKTGWMPDLNATFRQGSCDDSITTNRTIFMAAQLVVLTAPCRYGLSLPLGATASGRVTLGHCGTSSYSVRTAVEAPRPKCKSGAEGDPPTMVSCGYAVHAFVNIDASTRRPVSINEDARRHAFAVLKCGEKEAGVPLLERLSERHRPSSADGVPHFRFSTHVRPFSDFDFNQHLNQGVYTTLALDAVKAAAASSPDLSKTGDHEWLARFLGENDVDARAVRIDYLKEVANPRATVSVDIYDGSRTAALSGLDFVGQVQASLTSGETHHVVWFEVLSTTPDNAEEVLNARGMLVLAGRPPAAA